MDATQVTRFTTLWTQAQRSVFAFISSTVTNFADAEDVLQRVSTIAVTKFDEFSANGELSEFVAWSIAIARFEVLRHLRDVSTDRHSFVAESLPQLAAAFEEIAPECDARREALATCVSKLSGRSREVLEKRYGEGLKTGVIAKLLGLTAGNVSVILNRTYQSLRQCVDTRLGAEAGAP